MNTINRDAVTLRSISRIIALLLATCLFATTAIAQIPKESGVAEKPAAEPPKPVGPVDEFDRGVPLTSVEGFLKTAGGGDYEQAAQYLDLRNLPRGMDKSQGPELARQLKIVFDRALWIDLELISNDPKGNLEDGLPSYRESLGLIKTPEKTVNILLQRVPRKDQVYIWKFSNRTVAEIPRLYEEYGYRAFEEALSRLFPDVVFLGWHTWQWVTALVFTGVAFIVALVPTWLVGLLVRRRETELRLVIARLVTGPVRIVLWLLLARVAIHIVGPSVTLRGAVRAGTVLTIAFAWATMRLVDVVFEWLSERFRKSGQESAIVLLRPVKNVSKIVIVLFAALVWLDNIGFDIGTILTGLGVGGLAVALAAQDTLKNFIGSIMILVDRPYQVGHRIKVKGHDGVVEDIGLRSTKMRLLNGHQTTIPNEQMARVDIENIGRRPHIQRLVNLGIPFDTPVEKVEKAVKIIEDTLDNHEGMDQEFPPRVYFNEFNPDSLNILIIYWYHPADWWAFCALNQRVNTQIMQEFKKEGIQFAFPTTTTYLAQDDGQPLNISTANDSVLAERSESP
jgi:MscS family membrane protein